MDSLAMNLTDAQKRAVELKDEIIKICEEKKLILIAPKEGIGFYDLESKKLVAIWSDSKANEETKPVDEDGEAPETPEVPEQE